MSRQEDLKRRVEILKAQLAALEKLQDRSAWALKQMIELRQVIRAYTI